MYQVPKTICLKTKLSINGIFYKKLKIKAKTIQQITLLCRYIRDLKQIKSDSSNYCLSPWSKNPPFNRLNI